MQYAISLLMYRCFEHKSSSLLTVHCECVCVSVRECRSPFLPHTAMVRLSLFWTLTDVRPIGFSQYSIYWSQQWTISLSLSLSVCMCISAHSIVIKCVWLCMRECYVDVFNSPQVVFCVEHKFFLLIISRYSQTTCHLAVDLLRRNFNYDRVNTITKQSKH